MIKFFKIFFELSAQLGGGQIAICRESWVVMYAPDTPQFYWPQQTKGTKVWATH